MDNKRYNVVIEKNPALPADATDKLAAIFKLPIEKANAILQKSEFAIKKDTDKATAEKFHKAISSTGALCRIDEIPEEDEEESALPTIEEVSAPSDVKPLTDITQPEIPPQHSEQMNLSLDTGPVEKSTSVKTEDKAIEDINPENFCPECGTIRANANSVCVHCGYDPTEVKQSNTKSKLVKIISALIISGAVGFLAFPYYQQYAKRAQIESNLNLAFDTRNTVTEFIEKTNFWPNQNIDAGLPKQIENQSIESIVLSDNAVMTVTIRANATGSNSQTLVFTPNTLKGRIVWNCLKGTLVDDLRPEICMKKVIE